MNCSRSFRHNVCTGTSHQNFWMPNKEMQWRCNNNVVQIYWWLLCLVYLVMFTWVFTLLLLMSVLFPIWNFFFLFLKWQKSKAKTIDARNSMPLLKKRLGWFFAWIISSKKIRVCVSSGPIHADNLAFAVQKKKNNSSEIQFSTS